MSSPATSHAHSSHDHDSPDAIRKSVRKYLAVGGMLYVLTVVTVAIAYIELPTVPAIVLAMFVAASKASLVALFFMHLIDEKKLIYYTLLLTAVFFAICMLIPTFTDAEANTHRVIWEDVPPAADHGGGHGEEAGGEHGGEHGGEDVDHGSDGEHH